MAPPLLRTHRPDADLLLTLSVHQESWRVGLSRALEGTFIAEELVSPVEAGAFESRFLALAREGRLTLDEAEVMGSQLAGVLLPPKIERAVLAEAKGQGVRLRVRTDESSQLQLPWEYLRTAEGFVSQLPWLHLVRETQGGPRSVASSRSTTTVLVVYANPGSVRYPLLASARAEVDAIVSALGAAECRGIEVETILGATPKATQERLAKGDVDVVHFVGHADVLTTGSALIFEGSKKGEHVAVYADELTKWLVGGNVRFAMLSGCLTGSPQGMASQLSSVGLDAVVAMQFPIRDTSALLFFRAFYASLQGGLTYEESVYLGRMSIVGTGVDWGIPVLFSPIPFNRLRDSKTRVGARHNVPSDDRPFIGREKELRDLRKTVFGPTKRLFTVTGMGGMGKTRLARQFARTAADSFADGVCFVECEALENDEELRLAIGTALLLDDLPTDWEAIAANLANRELLLVLDCFERLVANGGRLDFLLKRTSKLKILVSSRILLGLSWEQEFVLHPMSKRASGVEGIELFVEAASHADPGFRLTSENRKKLRTLVEDLEAVPLAIVLAAGRLRHLSLEELHDKVRINRLETLKRRAQGYDRHQDLIRVVDDSFSLLSESDRSLAFKLSVFRGGFYVEDAEAVLRDEFDVQEAIYALRDNSLLTSQVVDARMRFRALDTIREYIERVAPDELRSVARAHAEYFARLAATVRQKADAANLAEAKAELLREAGNFRAAISYAVEAQDSILVRSLASSLARPYLEAGARSDFDFLSVAADRHATIDGDLPLRIELSGLQGALYRREGDFARARDLWLLRASLAETAKDMDTFADSMLDVADLALDRKDLDSAEAIVSRVEALGEKVTSRPLRASGILLRARVRIERKELAAAISLAQGAEELVENLHGDRQAMYVWFSLAQVYRKCGSLAASERLCRHMIREGLEGGYTHYMGRALLQLSSTLEEAGQIDHAFAAVAAALAIPRTASEAVRQEANRWAKQLSDRTGVPVPKPGSQDWEELARACTSGNPSTV